MPESWGSFNIYPNWPHGTFHLKGCASLKGTLLLLLLPTETPEQLQWHFACNNLSATAKVGFGDF